MELHHRTHVAKIGIYSCAGPYARWLPDDWRILVLVDRDRDDCRALKNELEETAQRAGLRTVSRNARWQVANRIVIEELEAWYFGDWQAVQGAYPKVSPRIPNRRGYRDPDGIADTWEAFVAQHMDPAVNRSGSFSVFHHTLMEAVSADAG